MSESKKKRLKKDSVLLKSVLFFRVVSLEREHRTTLL